MNLALEASPGCAAVGSSTERVSRFHDQFCLAFDALGQARARTRSTPSRRTSSNSSFRTPYRTLVLRTDKGLRWRRILGADPRWGLASEGISQESFSDTTGPKM